MANFDFDKDVLEESRRIPVVVDFWAEWCAPCRVLGPILEQLATRAEGRFRLVKLNTDQYPDLAARYQIASIPAVKLFKDGAVVSEFTGALPEREVARWLESNLPTKGRELLAQAIAALAAADRSKSESLLQAAVAAEPQLWEAHVRLAELRFRADPAAALASVDAVPANDPSHDRIEFMRTLWRLVTQAKANEPPPAGVPATHWQRYLDGARAFAAGEDTAALDAWIDVLRRNKGLDDDGPRRACVALFHLLGDNSDVTRGYRRIFTSALY